MDEITGCTEHKELGTTEDGKYKYYLSINKNADADLTAELEKIDVTLTERTPFNANQSAFDEPAQNTNPDASNVGTFETTDIDGNSYTEKVFSDYDLTLVNAFTTWCSPCVNEMPELEKLYEPTGNLDVETAENIISLLKDISMKGTAVIMSTHNISLIDKYPGIKYSCEDGTLVEK